MKNKSKLGLGVGLGIVIGAITGNFAMIGVGLLFGVSIGTPLSNKTKDRNKS